MNKHAEIETSPQDNLARLERLARLMRSANHGQGLNPAQWEALRYLAKANRFSNSPGALTQYLGATKGTISQTVKALERKGHIVKSARPQEKRSVILLLTEKGTATLQHDPLQHLEKAIGELSSKTQRRMDKGIATLLADEALRQKAPAFGSCRDCRFFRQNGNSDNPDESHLCMLFVQPLSTRELDLTCIAHASISIPK